MIPKQGPRMTPTPSDSPAFEPALAELERILRSLEDGTTNLEDSLSQYERGVSLLKNCYQKLRDAEQRILKVAGVDAEGKPVLEEFEHAATLPPVEEKKRRKTI
ncbi:MAG: exodeoxyribonuclease VII small subunit [Planctomycetes bacterium]|nr:exodeoxyribonuclease VII small subunit [Planctomycetota bacterium]